MATHHTEYGDEHEEEIDCLKLSHRKREEFDVIEVRLFAAPAPEVAADV